MTALTFRALREANLRRLRDFKDPDGTSVHLPDGSDWSPNDWLTAVTGELGELAHLLKDVRKSERSMANARYYIKEELADVAIYLDVLAHSCGVDLDAAITDKFNAVSVRIGSLVRIADGAAVDVPKRCLMEDCDQEVTHFQPGVGYYCTMHYSQAYSISD